MKKILLIIVLIMAIFQMMVLAVEIDMGYAATDRSDRWPDDGYTLVDKGNPANASGIITSIEVWTFYDTPSAQVATFYVVAGNNLTTRDTETIGEITGGSKQTFEVNLDVEAGDFIGIYNANKIELDWDGGGNFWYVSGDQVPCTDVTFTIDAEQTYVISLYGTGTTGNGAAEDNAIFMGMNF